MSVCGALNDASQHGLDKGWVKSKAVGVLRAVGYGCICCAEGVFHTRDYQDSCEIMS